MFRDVVSVHKVVVSASLTSGVGSILSHTSYCYLKYKLLLLFDFSKSVKYQYKH